MDLNRFPRAAKTVKQCTLDMLKTDGSVPMINLFKQKRTKGWWPLYIKTDNEGILLQVGYFTVEPSSLPFKKDFRHTFWDMYLHNSYNGFTKIYFLFKCSVILLQIVAMRKDSLSQNLHQRRLEMGAR